MAGIVGGTWCAAYWGLALAGFPPPPGYPVQLLRALARAQVPWPAQSTLIAAGLGLLLVPTVAAAVPVPGRRRAGPLAQGRHRAALITPTPPGTKRYTAADLDAWCTPHLILPAPGAQPPEAAPLGHRTGVTGRGVALP